MLRAELRATASSRSRSTPPPASHAILARVEEPWLRRTLVDGGVPSSNSRSIVARDRLLLDVTKPLPSANERHVGARSRTASGGSRARLVEEDLLLRSRRISSIGSNIRGGLNAISESMPDTSSASLMLGYGAPNANTRPVAASLCSRRMNGTGCAKTSHRRGCGSMIVVETLGYGHAQYAGHGRKRSP